MEEIEDPSNIKGINLLLNKDNVSNKINIEEIEQDMIGNIGVQEVKQVDPAAAFKEALSGLNSDFKMMEFKDQLNYELPVDQTESPTSYQTEPQQTMSYTQPPNNQRRFEMQEPRGNFENSEKLEQLEQMDNDMYNIHEPKTVFGAPMPPRSEPNSSFFQMTEEHKRQTHVNNVLRDLDQAGGVSGFSVENERREDTKGFLLEDIDTLKGELVEDDVDISRIPNVDHSSSLEEVENVHKELKRKYDRRRYCSFANDFILAGVYGLEMLFDGERQWGPYQPDLTDWHNTVKVKLRRMRYETSTIVSNIMQEYNIGPGTRIMLELIPSMILHSRMRSSQYDEESYTGDEMAQAYDDLRNFENT